MAKFKKTKDKEKKLKFITSFQKEFINEFSDLKDFDGYDFVHRAMALQAMESLDFLRKSLILQVLSSKKHRVYQPKKSEKTT